MSQVSQDDLSLIKECGLWERDYTVHVHDFVCTCKLGFVWVTITNTL